MATANDRSKNPLPDTAFQPDTMPPDVIQIEAPCSLAETRTPDNSSWTNVLREPIMVKQGSELRVTNSFIDMRGIDAEIIQFQKTGSNRNNTHTMLFQHYTCNDGMNNKTCTYDYMCYGTSLKVVDPGEGYFISSPIDSNTVKQTGSGNDLLEVKIEGAPEAIRPINFSITSGGQDYDNGDLIYFGNHPNNNDNALGRAVVDDIGTIKNVIFERFFMAAGSTDNSSNIQTRFGTGASFTWAKTVKGCNISGSGLIGSRGDTQRGEGYKRGDRVYVLEDSSGPVPDSDRAVFEIQQIEIGKRGVHDKALFDQGYNYQESPVYRWGQTFELTEAFTYGNDTGDRTFVSDNGEIRTINPNSLHENDPCLSSDILIRNREDEFVSGVFHNRGTNKISEIYKPILHWKNVTDFNQIQITAGIENFTIEQVAPDQLQRNGVVFDFNTFSSFSPGTTFQIYFRLDPNVVSSTALQNEMRDLFSSRYSGIFEMSDYEIGLGKAIFGNSLVDYVGEPSEYLWNFQIPGFVQTPVDPNQFPNKSNEIVDLVLVYKPDSLPDPEILPKLNISTDANSVIQGIGLAGEGRGCRVGMIFKIDPSTLDTNERFSVRQVDNSFGMRISQSDISGLSNSDLQLSGGEKVEAFFIPQPFYRKGTNFENSIGLQKTYNPTFEIGSYPSTLDSCGLRNSSSITDIVNSGNLVVSSKAFSCIHKSGGVQDENSLEYEPSTAFRSYHSQKANFTITEDNKTNYIESHSFTFGFTGLIVPISGADWLTPQTGTVYGKCQLKIDQAKWTAAGYSFEDLPQQTYLIVNEGTADEFHMITAGIFDDSTYYYIDILSRDVHDNNITLNTGSQAYWDALFDGTLTNPEFDVPRTNNTPIQPALGTIDLTWIKNPLLFNNKISVKWGDGQDLNTQTTGTIALTAPMNFYGNSDPNKSKIEEISKSYTYPNNILNSYSKGGTYYLTQFTGELAVPENQPQQTYPPRDTTLFSRGYSSWAFCDLPSKNYEWLGSDFVQPTEITNNRSFSNIPYIHSYYPMINEKTFNIDKSFCIPSDIAGIWTEQSHELTGAVDMISGSQYVDSSDTGLLQNQFIMPIYGSNNDIGPDGLYIPDNLTYPQSNGLEPGHVVGINYIDEKQNWLNDNLVLDLPVSDDDRKFYYVYFRTNWTPIRSWDPLKKLASSSDSAAEPDRTSLITVNLDAGKVGNEGKKALDGSTIGVSPKVLYELGEASGVLASGTPVRFGQENHYPIRYLSDSGLYPKAKASQYIGTNNATLVYSNEISAFTFEFFHQPFTAPFVEGQGGDNSSRVFYGNRLEGIYNQERLGGVFSINYIRPDYPKGVFLYEEIDTYTSQEYPFGVNPYTDISPLGQNFLNKLGFLDPDIGVKNNKIDLSLGKVQIEYIPYQKNISDGMDSIEFPPEDYLVKSYKISMNGTTTSDVDSSDALLTEVDAPETNAGLFENNVKLIPEHGNKNPRILKWGSYIFYPYSLNTDTNSFDSTKSNVRYDNASSTYGSVGGLLVSNTGRGQGLPNTTGSTFLVDDSSIPRTLNPDCNLYLSFTVGTDSSLIKASVLPRKLNNGFLVILSNLIKQPTFYMPKAGFVNAISVAPKTFITGDFISAMGTASLYAKHDFMLSEIQTTIKDTEFDSPSTLGINSTVIYSITNYNPKPAPILPTITQIQDREMEVINMLQQHNQNQKGGGSSPLQDLYSNIQALGLDLLSGSKKQGDIVSAIQNQINFHDLPNLTKKERTTFFRTNEGEALLDNIRQVNELKQTADDLADAQLDIESPYANAESQRRLEFIQKSLQRQARQTEQAVRERTPAIFFQPSDPVEYQIPPLTSIGDMNKKEIPEKDFFNAIPHRYRNFREYKKDRIDAGRRPVSFEEYQNFHYGNVILPPVDSNVPEEFIPDFNKMYTELSEDTKARANLDPFQEAYLDSQPREFVPGDVDSFQDEVQRGVADLSRRQREILNYSNVDIPRVERGRRLQKIVDDPSKGVFSSDKHGELGDKGFYSQEEKTAAEREISKFKFRLKGDSRGRPSKERQQEKQQIQREMLNYLDTLPRAKVETKKQRLELSNIPLTEGAGEIERKIAEFEKVGGKKSFRNEEYKKLITARDFLESQREGGGGKPDTIRLDPIKTVDSRNREEVREISDIPIDTGRRGQSFYRVIRDTGKDYEPIRDGMDATKRPQDKINKNNIFGENTVWMAETPEGATNFAHENLFNPKGEPKRDYEDRKYKIYKVDVEGLRYRRLHNIASNHNLVEATNRISLPKDEEQPKTGYLASVQRHLAYSRNMAPNSKEVAVEGKIIPERISLYQGETSLPVSAIDTPTGKKVQEGMKKYRDEGSDEPEIN